MCEGKGGIADVESTEKAVILDEAGVGRSPDWYGGVGGNERIEPRRWVEFRLPILASDSLW